MKIMASGLNCWSSENHNAQLKKPCGRRKVRYELMEGLHEEIRTCFNNSNVSTNIKIQVWFISDLFLADPFKMLTASLLIALMPLGSIANPEISSFVQRIFLHRTQKARFLVAWAQRGCGRSFRPLEDTLPSSNTVRLSFPRFSGDSLQQGDCGIWGHLSAILLEEWLNTSLFEADTFKLLGWFYFNCWITRSFGCSITLCAVVGFLTWGVWPGFCSTALWEIWWEFLLFADELWKIFQTQRGVFLRWYALPM